jgi:hypothetical protein
MPSLTFVLVCLPLFFSSVTTQAITAQQCLMAIQPMPEEQRQEILTMLIDKKVLLSAFQMEAVMQIAAKENRLPNYKMEPGNFSDPRSRKPLNDLKVFLSNADRSSEPLRNDFAEKVLKYMETSIFPGPNDPASQTLQNRLQKFYIGEEIRPNPKQAEIAFDYFKQVLQTPGGRDLLKNAILNSNATVAQLLYKGQRPNGFRTTAVSAGVLTTAIGAPISIGACLSGMLDPALVGVVAAPAFLAMTVPFLYAMRPNVTARIRLVRAIEKRRLKKLIANQPLTETVLPPAPLKITEPLLTRTFNREMVNTHSAELEKLEPLLNTYDFATVASFGREAVEKVDHAIDLIGILSSRMDLLEKDIDQLKPNVDNATEINDRVLVVSAEILQDADVLKTYLARLDGKLTEHISIGKSALDNNKLNDMATAEMNDVLEELRNAHAVLESATAVIPLSIQVVQTQRSILRELRSSLRSGRLSSVDQIAKLKEAITKLKSTATPAGAGLVEPK